MTIESGGAGLSLRGKRAKNNYSSNANKPSQNKAVNPNLRCKYRLCVGIQKTPRKKEFLVYKKDVQRLGTRKVTPPAVSCMALVT